MKKPIELSRTTLFFLFVAGCLLTGEPICAASWRAAEVRGSIRFYPEGHSGGAGRSLAMGQNLNDGVLLRAFDPARARLVLQEEAESPYKLVTLDFEPGQEVRLEKGLAEHRGSFFKRTWSALKGYFGGNTTTVSTGGVEFGNYIFRKTQASTSGGSDTKSDLEREELEPPPQVAEKGLDFPPSPGLEIVPPAEQARRKAAILDQVKSRGILGILSGSGGTKSGSVDLASLLGSASETRGLDALGVARFEQAAGAYHFWPDLDLEGTQVGGPGPGRLIIRAIGDSRRVFRKQISPELKRLVTGRELEEFFGDYQGPLSARYHPGEAIEPADTLVFEIVDWVALYMGLEEGMQKKEHREVLVLLGRLLVGGPDQDTRLFFKPDQEMFLLKLVERLSNRKGVNRADLPFTRKELARRKAECRSRERLERLENRPAIARPRGIR